MAEWLESCKQPGRSVSLRRFSYVRPDLVPLRDLQDLVSGIGVNEVGVIGGDVRLNLLDQFVLALGFDGRATRAVDLHAVLPQSWSADSTPALGSFLAWVASGR